LKGVVEQGGTATKASLPGYDVAGKTGTAQKVIGGQYSHTKFISSFVGILPADHPQLVILVSVDEPQGVTYGGLVAAPVFKKIAWEAIRELGISPVKTPGEERQPLVRQAGLLQMPDLGFGSRKEIFPDFRKQSMRKVMAVLDDRGLDCEIAGSGVAVAQEPLPGVTITDGQRCRIVFESE
jgi:cell division protein FtsI (penicillin-binding protein 3)